jgi:FMN phosphatase YigB (HAD superfamily)
MAASSPPGQDTPPCYGAGVPLLLADLDNTLIERKLRHTGLDREVAGWVISEGAGLRKPDPEIFRFAAARAGQPLDGAWMIGDSAEADISGARDAGQPGVWLHRGRPGPHGTAAAVVCGVCPGKALRAPH